MAKLSIISLLNANLRFASFLRCALQGQRSTFTARSRDSGGFCTSQQGRTLPEPRDPVIWSLQSSRRSLHSSLETFKTPMKRCWLRSSAGYVKEEQLILLSQERVYSFCVRIRSFKKKSELTVAISMTLISKIGNNLFFFLQKQQPKDKKQKPAWMKQFKFKCCSILVI